MPWYVYRCNRCNAEKEQYHTMQGFPDLCDCGAGLEDLQRVPQTIELKYKEKPDSPQQQSGKANVGNLTRRHIEKARQDLKEQKQDLLADALKEQR